MITYEYGNPEADTVLIQPTGEHELASLENEVREIEKRTSKEFRFIATKVENWNDDLSPWKAPAVFKTEDFDGGASKTLENIIALCVDKNRKYYIGGYSLAGLFALWAACQTDIFSGVAAASPSVWFPGFIDYMKTYKMKSQNVYLSLGDREEILLWHKSVTASKRNIAVYWKMELIVYWNGIKETTLKKQI